MPFKCLRYRWLYLQKQICALLAHPSQTYLQKQTTSQTRLPHRIQSQCLTQTHFHPSVKQLTHSQYKTWPWLRHPMLHLQFNGLACQCKDCQKFKRTKPVFNRYIPCQGQGHNHDPVPAPLIPDLAQILASREANVAECFFQ